MSVLHILLIEDCQADYLLIARQLRHSELDVALHWAKDEPELIAALAARSYDLVLSDYKVPGLDFLQSMQRIKHQMPDVPLILVSGSVGEETAVDLLKSGLTDFVLKDRLLRLIPAIKRGLNEVRERQKRLQAETLLRSVIDNANSGIWVKDSTGKILVINDFLLQLLNKTKEEVIGQTVFDLLPHEQAAEYTANERFVLESGRPIEREETIVFPDGVHTFLSIKFPLKDEAGSIHSLGAICSDITRIKQAETELKRQEEQYRQLSQEYRTLLDNVPDGIVHLGPDLSVLWANAAARKIIDLPEEVSCSSRPCHEVFWHRHEPCTHCPVVRCQQTLVNEFASLSPDGKEKMLEIRAVPLQDDNGALIGIIEIIRDITAHRRLEEQFRQAQKMESIGTFAGGIAHDFNNILSAILGYGEIALEDLEVQHPAYKSVRTIVDAGLRASHLTKDLLMFSRKQVSKKEPVDLNRLITRLEKFIRRIIGEDIQLETHLATRPLRLLADSHQIDQVLMNFATNARDAMPGGGLFAITTQPMCVDQHFIETHGFGQPGYYAQITVADTGKGMDQATMSKIFDPFFTTKEMGKGTGLGMSVVYGIIAEHQGHIAVHSEPGKGAAFELYLPLLDQHQEAPPNQHPPQRLRAGTETILLAEDEWHVRELYATALERAGYTVLTAINGEEAVQLFRTCGQRIDLLIFDLVMPKMNGKLAMEAIDRLQPDIKGLFISGYAPENILQSELRDLNKEMFLKPGPPKELLHLVRKILDS